MIGCMNKSKRVISRRLFEKKNILGNSQDGSREWITVLATICADGTALPPGLIYKATTGNLQDSWVQDLKPKEHTTFFASSPTGWTNDELGYEWLTSVFNRFMKDKARRRWRLLFLNGHRSHINMRFLEWCQQHKVIVCVYPPHTTH